MRPAAPDARHLSPQAQQDLRQRAVAAVEGGMSQLAAAAAFGVSRRAVGSWVRAHRAAGPEALWGRRRVRAPGEQCALNAEDQVQVLAQIVAGPPERAGLAEPLWNRRTIAHLIERQIGRQVTTATVGHYLLRWGLTGMFRTPRPFGVVPAVALSPGSSRRSGCETFWMSWIAVVPQVNSAPWSLSDTDPGRPTRIQALMAQGAGGGVCFLAGPGPFGTAGVIDFGERLAKLMRRPVHLVVCSWPREHASVLRLWTADPGPRVRLTLA